MRATPAPRLRRPPGRNLWRFQRSIHACRHLLANAYPVTDAFPVTPCHLPPANTTPCAPQATWHLPCLHVACKAVATLCRSLQSTPAVLQATGVQYGTCAYMLLGHDPADHLVAVKLRQCCSSYTCCRCCRAWLTPVHATTSQHAFLTPPSLARWLPCPPGEACTHPVAAAGQLPASGKHARCQPSTPSPPCIAS